MIYVVAFTYDTNFDAFQVAVAVQRAAKDRFDVDFEAVSGAGDFSAKINFSSDLVCKIKRDSA